MSHNLVFLFVLSLVLLIVTVVGHVIWLAVGAVFKAVSGWGQPSRRTHHCDQCGVDYLLALGQCPQCGAVQAGAAASPIQADLAAAERQINRLFAAGLIGAEQQAELLTTFREQTDRLIKPERKEPGRSTPATGEPPALEIDEFIEAEPTASQPTPSTPSRTEPAVTKPAVVDAEPSVSPRRRAVADLLQAFMEEKNIRWGELVSGLLIVGSAVGLVISLWASLKDAIPYFPALLFMAATTAIHGAGLYTLRRWNLKSTSRGLLTISMLLVPLNLLAAVALSDQRPTTDALYLFAVAIGLTVFGWITISGARIMMRGRTVLTSIAVLGPAAAQLYIGRLCGPGLSDGRLTLLAALPLASYLIATAGPLWQVGSGRRLSPRTVIDWLRLLGIAAFSLSVSLGLMFWKSAAVRETVSALSPGLSLAAAAVLGMGLVIHQRLTSNRLADMRTIGTALAVFGGLLMSVSVIAAWSRPHLLIAVGLVDFLALTVLAVRADLSLLHVGAVTSLSLAGLVGFHLASGTVVTARSLEQTLLMGRSGLVLTALAVLSGTAAWGLRRIGRAADGISYLYTAIGLGSLATLIALYAGFISGVDRNLTTPILWADAAILLAVSVQFRNQAAAWCGSVLLLVAHLHALEWNAVLIASLESHGLLPVRPGVAAALAHATVMALIALTGKRWAGWSAMRAEGLILSERRVAEVEHGDPCDSTEISPAAQNVSDNNGGRVATALRITAIISLGLSLPATVGVTGGLFTTPAIYTAWTAGVWLLLASVLESSLLFGIAQILGTVAVSFAVTGLCRDQIPWERIGPGSPFNLTSVSWLFGGRPHKTLAYFDPRHLHMQFSILTCWSLLWIGLRRLAGHRSLLVRLVRPDRLTVDRILLGAVAIATVGLAGWGCLPGLHLELATNVIRPSAVGPADALMLTVLMVLSVGTVLATGIATDRRTAVGLVLLILTGGAVLALFVPEWKIASSLMTVHHHAWGPGGWLSLGIVVAVMVAAMWERMSVTVLIGIILTLVTVPLLIAGRFETAGATASVLRWGLALYAFAAAIVLSYRRPLCLLVAQTGLIIRGDKVAGPIRTCVLAVSVAPILAWTLRAAFLFAGDASPPLPAEESWIARLSPAWMYAGPLGLLALVCLVYAIRERKPSFMSAVSLTISLAVSVAYLLPIWSSGTATGFADLIRLLQWNAVALGGCAVGWLLIQHWTLPAELSASEDAPTVSVAFTIQLRLAVVVVISLAAWAAVVIILRPGDLPVSVAALGHILSYVAVVLTMTASLGSAPRRDDSEPLHEIGLLVVALATFAASSTVVNNSAANWLSYHVLLIGWCIAAALFTMVAALVLSVPQTDATGEAGLSGVFRHVEARLRASVGPLVAWTGVMAGLVVLLAVRAEWSDPARPWWSMGATAVVAVLVATLGIAGRSQRAAYVSTGLAVLATSFVWLTPWLGLGSGPGQQSWVHLVEADVIVAVLVGLFWLGVDLWWQRRRSALFDPRWSSPPIQQTAGGIGLLAASVLAVVCLTIRTLSAADAVIPDVSNPGGWLMLVALGVLLKTSLWDRADRMGIAGLYVLGLIAVTLLLDALELSQRNLWFAIGLAAAGYPFLTGLIWTGRRRWVPAGVQLTIPAASISAARIARWLPTANLMLASVAAIIEIWVVLTFEDRSMRLYGASAAVLLAPGIAMLAQKRRRSTWQLLALLAVVVAAADFGWALMPVGGEQYFWLQRTIRLMVVLATTTFAYGVVVPRLLRPDHDWLTSVRRAATAVGGGALAALLVVLVMEGLWYVPGEGAPITALQIAVVAAALVGLSAGLISLAVQPGRDPLGLSEQGRTAYVYAAESVLALLFLHIYLTMPQLFTGILLPYWPFIVMGIAFFGVGVGELFSRMGLVVLSKPLRRTGAFLPLLPALGYWIHVSQAGPGVLRGDYSTLLMIVGVLYVIVSLWRQSFVYGLAAALAGNGALWALLQEHGQTILIHPQMWMIPPALSVLVATHWNRRQLGEAKLTAIRYLCVTIIYVSSTGEMFLTGAGESLALPMVLAGLSVAGVLAGILMRVRAFLYLGTSFLLLSIVSMVWHAARNIGHVWPWWVFGIVLGIAILTLFGLFEKRRQDMLALLDNMRHWER